MTNPFYRAFEDRYRGARAIIKGRLYKYQPFLAALHAHHPGAAALDLGCGRGEWLEVLGEQGFAGRGVDLDAGMLAACIERGLDVSEQDALAALAALPDNSVAVVSAFHLVEHIPFEMVRALVSQALRVLLPGGLLIMETPNPENIVVGSCDFYTDPSHLRPIPPNLLAFAAEHGGFARQAVVRLQEDAQLHGDAPLHLLTVLEGASPDYSVVAQKNAGAELLAGFDGLFGSDYGITMKTLALRYESQAAARHAEIHHVLGSLTERISADRAASAAEHEQVSASAARLAEQLGATNQVVARDEARLGRLETEVRDRLDARIAQVESDVRDKLQARIERVESDARTGRLALERELAQARELQQRTLAEWQAGVEARLAQSDQLTREQAQRIADLLQSRSWRVTAPVRWLGIRARVLRQIAGEARAQGRSGSAAVARRLLGAVLRRLGLLETVRAIVSPLPGEQAAPDVPPASPEIAPAAPADAAPATGTELPARAARIYHELKQAHQARKDRCV